MGHIHFCTNRSNRCMIRVPFMDSSFIIDTVFFSQVLIYFENSKVSPHSLRFHILHLTLIYLCQNQMPHAPVDLKRNTKSVANLKDCTPRNRIFLQLGKTWVKAILRFDFQSAIVLKQISMI